MTNKHDFEGGPHVHNLLLLTLNPAVGEADYVR